MTREEFTKIVLALKSVYTAPTLLATKESLDMWYASLQDIDYNTCKTGVVAYIQSEEKLPTPAGIRNKIVELSQMGELNEMQAWGLVSKALRNGLYHSQEEFDKLPENVKKAVGSAEQLHNWATSDYGTIESVIQSNFLRSYRRVVEKEKQVSLLPAGVRANMKIGTENKLAIETGVMNNAKNNNG